MFLGVPSYEIVWSDPSNYFKGLVSENQIVEGKIDHEKLWSTIEPQVLVEKAYPEVVEAFKQSKIKPPKISKRKKKQKISENIENTSITAPVAKKTRKTKSTKMENNKDNILDTLENSFKQLDMESTKNKIVTLDNFLKKAVLNNAQNYVRGQITSETVELKFDEQQMQTSTPSKSGQNLNTNWSSFYDDDEDADLSDIIDGIIARKPDFIQDHFRKLNLNGIENVKLSTNDEINSSFFVNHPVENDLFEKTFNELIHIDSDDTTEEYELDEIDNILRGNVGVCGTENQHFQKNETVEGDSRHSTDKDEMFDSFLGCDIGIPLIERLKMKPK